MTNAFFAPFNNQPTSVTFHTAPVTLGANEYALLRVMPEQELDDNAIQGDQGLTINGNLVIPQTYWVSADADTSESANFYCNGTLYASSDSSMQLRIYRRVNGVDISFNTLLGLVSNFMDVDSIRVYAGDRMFINSASNRKFKATLVPDNPLPTEFWLSPSTVISSGDGSIVRPYMLERYAAIS